MNKGLEAIFYYGIFVIKSILILNIYVLYIERLLLSMTENKSFWSIDSSLFGSRAVDGKGVPRIECFLDSRNLNLT